MRQSRSARTQAFVDILDKPVILAANEPEAFARLQHYESELRDWLQAYPGWQLERSREMLRLVRTPACYMPGMDLEGLRDPKDYLLLALILYFAESSAARGAVSGGVGDRFLLSTLAENLASLVRLRYGVGVFDFGEMAHRRSLVRVMRLLESLRALIPLDGSAGEWAEQTATGDGLYLFTEVIHQLMIELPPAEILTQLQAAQPQPLHGPLLVTADPEQRAWRTLLLGPALLAVDDPEAFDVVAAQHNFIGRELADLFDWRLDVRKGMARIVRETHAQDAGYVLLSARHRAEYGVILLLCNRLRWFVQTGALQPDARDGITLTYSEFCAHLLGLRDEHRDLLAGGLGVCKPDELFERVLTVMRENGMLRGPDRLQDIYLTPLCALYRGIIAEAAPETQAEGSESSEQLRFSI